MEIFDLIWLHRDVWGEYIILSISPLLAAVTEANGKPRKHVNMKLIETKTIEYDELKAEEGNGLKDKIVLAPASIIPTTNYAL